MARLQFAPFFPMLMSFACLANEPVALVQPEDRVVSQPSYTLSAEQIKQFSEEANKGSGDAAMKLSDHYFYLLPKGKIEQMQRRALDWALIGAENGDPRLMFRAYQLMAVSKDRLTQTRALYWLERAAKNGDEDGVRELKACPNIDAKRRFGSPCYGPEPA
ncbi:hypothetical protein J5226_24015 [Lysobacter sp. K5869]|uniref:hypothetical protein n=1 Tax=Lysobacter sp. K5869 TaxID=2820808 RepID=UPI001C05FB3F|nr:hypothetical protein [Lysobacter sp. K5869]QWP76604.1 hypothetical protein J5226_24015 [Lysobacter sp. K5869]